MYIQNDCTSRKWILKGMALKGLNTLAKLKTAEVSNFENRLASFRQVGLICDPHIKFQNSRNGHDN